MSATPQNKDNQEVDLSIIAKKIGGFFDGILSTIFRGILFIKKKLLVFISLFVVGAVLGYLLDVSANTYKHEIIVTPYFVSTDYLYAKIDLLQSKINEGDTVFLKSIGIENPRKIKDIEIKPVIDIYTFVNNNSANAASAQNSQNFELLKLLAEEGDINKVIKDNMTSKNFQNHTISITTEGITSNKVMIDPILKFLNTNEYFDKIRKASINNIHIKMKFNEQMIKQIDSLIIKISLTMDNNEKSDKLIYYNENTQIGSLIDKKNEFIGELAAQRINLISLEDFVKKVSSVLNVKDAKGINGKMKFVLPLVLIFGFIGLSLFMAFYKKQAAKILK